MLSFYHNLLDLHLDFLQTAPPNHKYLGTVRCLFILPGYLLDVSRYPSHFQNFFTSRVRSRHLLTHKIRATPRILYRKYPQLLSRLVCAACASDLLPLQLSRSNNASRLTTKTTINHFPTNTMGNRQWIQDEKNFFFRVILPQSQYPHGVFVKEGTPFSQLAAVMQQAMKDKGVGERVYTESSLFQHYYQVSIPLFLVAI